MENITFVIFDTSTIPEYYLDVHNLLAYPSGWILRYEYREKYLCPKAIEICNKHIKESCDIPVLLMYGQGKNYLKSKCADKPKFEKHEMIWAATRFAKIIYINLENDNYYFYMELGGYPSEDTNGLNAIIDCLGDYVPFNKWVTVGYEDLSQATRKLGSSEENWKNVVCKIGAPPFQFSGDSFWRIISVTQNNKRKSKRLLINHSLLDHIECPIIDTFENCQLEFHIQSYSPTTDTFERNSKSITVDYASYLMQPENPSKIDIRRYGSSIYPVHTNVISGCFLQKANITFSSDGDNNTFPNGPKLSFLVCVRKSKLKFTLFSFSFILGTILLAITPYLDNTDLQWKILCSSIGVVLLAASFFLNNRELPFSL